MKAYAIKDLKGRLIIYTASKSAKLSKAKFCQITGPFDWKVMYKSGYRCVPVEITETKPNKKPKPLSGEPLKALHKAIKASAKKSTELKDRK